MAVEHCPARPLRSSMGLDPCGLDCGSCIYDPNPQNKSPVVSKSPFVQGILNRDYSGSSNPTEYVVVSVASVGELEEILQGADPNMLVVISRKDLEKADTTRVEELTRSGRVLIYSSERKVLPSDFISSQMDTQS